MELAEVEKRLENAICQLYTKDKYLLKVDAAERSITHRLGLYLQDSFKGWDVDCEYNRYGQDPKKISSNELKPGKKKRRVYPDIVIHKRGVEGFNLLVIEAKKVRNKRKDRDLEKLRGYKLELNYQYAAFLEVYIGQACRTPTICWICE